MSIDSLSFVKTANETKFIGPRGGHSKDGLEDDRMEPGNEVRIILGSGKTAKEIHLPYRKGNGNTTKDKNKDK